MYVGLPSPTPPLDSCTQRVTEELSLKAMLLAAKLICQGQHFQFNIRSCPSDAFAPSFLFNIRANSTENMSHFKKIKEVKGLFLMTTMFPVTFYSCPSMNNTFQTMKSKDTAMETQNSATFKNKFHGKANYWKAVRKFSNTLILFCYK
jgi:hypothetical protein